MSRSDVFLEHLYKEKEIHKEHRHKHVIYKLVLTGSFFGLGQFAGREAISNLFLYIVPFIALVHDVYIVGEHLKVQRVGSFIRSFDGIVSAPVCAGEVVWEKYLMRHRETWSYKASLLYTTVVSTFCAVVIYRNPGEFASFRLYLLWLALWFVSLIIVWIHAAQLEIRLRKIGDEGDKDLVDELQRHYRNGGDAERNNG